MKNQIFILIFVLGFIVCLSGCKSDVPTANETKTTVSETALSMTETSVTSETQIVEDVQIEETEIVNSFTSIDYELDLEKLKENKGYDYYFSLRDELSFLDDEQFEVYIRALIAIRYVEWFSMPNTNRINSFFLWENDDGTFTINDQYYVEFEGYCSYQYVSTYSSFYKYLQSVFTQESVDKFLDKYTNEYGFFTLDDELWVCFGDRGGRIYKLIESEYKLVENSENEVVFEYVLYCEHDGKEWTDIYTISLKNTENGWRSEIFDYWD